VTYPDNTVTIDHWRAEYRVPRHHPAPEHLKSRLDDAIGHLAREVLDSALQPLVSTQDESVWLIRRLELELTANTAWDQDRTAASWARNIARELDRILQAGPDGQNVLRFADGASYLAYFLADLVEGKAWSRWYYRAFEGLRPLPTSVAARTAILRNSPAGFQALLRLPADLFKRLNETLSSQDARRVLDGLGLGGPEAGDWLEPFIRTCQQTIPLALGEEHFALQLFLETSRRLGQPGGPGLAAVARAAGRLRQLLAVGAGARLVRALLAAARGSLADLYTQAGPADAERLAPLATLPPDQLAVLLVTLSGGQARATSETRVLLPRRYTPFGGIFLLLPELDHMPLASMLAGFPSLADEDPQAALRLLLLVRAGGRSRSTLHFGDPVLRDLAGITPRFTSAAAATWLNQVPDLAWRQFVSALVEVDGSPTPGAAGLGLVQVPLAGRGAIALVNLQDGSWLSLVSLDQRRQSHWPALRPFLEANMATPWFGDPDLISLARQHVEFSPPTMPGSNPAKTDQATRLAHVPKDLRFLLAPVDWRLARPADLALALATQRLLRRFSRGLGGFQQSGLPYLFSNFLDFNAGMDEEPERRAVFVGRPLLALVLQRTGQLRQTYRLTWSDGRRFELYPEA
jgi:hypothetical protein